MTTKKFALTWRTVLVGLIVLVLLAGCQGAAPAPAAEGGEAAAGGGEAAAPAAADAPELPEVPRDRTLVVMAGGPNTYAQFDNQNPFIPGSDQAFHTGTLPAMYEPLIMFNVLTGEYENWLAESWEYNDDYTEITIKLRDGIKWDDGEALNAD
ncbi:MAG: hypothetical protein KDE53_27955, partial [Caldilineaceae bacterium]|nr:hypothetical protein [Caldilineaceae bacterium]